MLIIAGYFNVPPAERQTFIEAHADLVTRGRAYPGCLDLSISPDPIDAARVDMMELWESSERLDAWRRVANPPETGIAIEGGSVQKHEISRSGSPF